MLARVSRSCSSDRARQAGRSSGGMFAIRRRRGHREMSSLLYRSFVGSLDGLVVRAGGSSDEDADDGETDRDDEEDDDESEEPGPEDGRRPPKGVLRECKCDDSCCTDLRTAPILTRFTGGSSRGVSAMAANTYAVSLSCGNDLGSSFGHCFGNRATSIVVGRARIANSSTPNIVSSCARSHRNRYNNVSGTMNFG